MKMKKNQIAALSEISSWISVTNIQQKSAVFWEIGIRFLEEPGYYVIGDVNHTFMLLCVFFFFVIIPNLSLID